MTTPNFQIEDMTLHNLAPKPFKVHPFFDLMRQGCPWLGDVKAIVLDCIKQEQERITAEAHADGQPELADEKFLYERFIFNRDHDMLIANWRILKYFIRTFRLKIYYDMIGEWKFTSNDVEMYNHFNSIKVTAVTKCMPRYLKFKTDDKEDNLRFDYPSLPQAMFVDGHCKYQVLLKEPNYYPTGYINLFEYECWLLQSMVQNVRMETKWKTDNFFTTSHLHTHHVHFTNDYEVFAIRQWEPVKQHEVSHLELKEAARNYLYKKCSENSELCSAIDTLLSAEHKASAIFSNLYNSCPIIHKTMLDEEGVNYTFNQLLAQIRYTKATIEQGGTDGYSPEVQDSNIVCRP